MADSDDDSDSRFDDVDLESILARVERRGPLTFTRKRCLYRAPEFVRRLAAEETVNEGETVKFDCKVFAFPKASVKWYKDNEEIKDVPNIKTESLENGEYAITIEEIKKADEGAYKCKVENPEGSSSSTIYVAVKAKNKSPKKKNPACAVTFPSPFPPITENVEAEEREAKEVATQAESPLTHLYNGVKWKNRTWPDFLGGWECVNGFDLRDFGEMEDEDVFLPEDSNNNEKNEKRKSVPNVDSTSDSFIGNGIQETMANHVTIPNLVFENKNLQKEDSSKKTIYRSSFIHSNTKPDENGNLGTQNIDQSSALHETNLQTDQVKSVCKGNDTPENILGNNIRLSSCANTSDTQKIHLSNSIDRVCKRLEINAENGDAGSDNRSEFFFLISGFTLLALCIDMAPDMFVFSVFIGQLLYCMIRFLLKEV